MRRTTGANSGQLIMALLILILCAVGAAGAQEGDPPGRIARLSAVQGEVLLQPAGLQEWGAAALNRPLTRGDRLWSAENARVELDLGDAAIRLGSNTAFAFFMLDDHSVQMQLTVGTLIVHVRQFEQPALYEVDTPNLVVTLRERGSYRIEVSGMGDISTVQVSEGSAQADGADQRRIIGAQQMVRFSGMQNLNVLDEPLYSADELDDWSAMRERARARSVAGEYVAADTPGLQDLDAHGVWEYAPDYGYVWSPTVFVVNWAPYRFGQWVWIAPWGWTWLDATPWGFAPFHYGRWVLLNSTWCWVPGPKRSRPMYTPAVVGWVGAPRRAASAASGATVGWFPLGPRELYRPARATSAAYVRGINLSNTAVSAEAVPRALPNSNYINNTSTAVTAVPQAVLAGGERISQALLVKAPADATASATAPAIVPLRASVLGTAAARTAPPGQYLNRAVLARTPPPHAPAAFDKQTAAIAANGGTALSGAELAHLAPPTAAGPVRMLLPEHRAAISAAGTASAAVAGPTRPPGSAAATRGTASAAPIPPTAPAARASPLAPSPPAASARPVSAAPAGAHYPPAHTGVAKPRAAPADAREDSAPPAAHVSAPH